MKTITARHIADLEGRIAGMQSMVSALKHLASHCRGNDRPDCPILDGLAAHTRGCREPWRAALSGSSRHRAFLAREGRRFAVTNHELCGATSA